MRDGHGRRAAAGAWVPLLLSTLLFQAAAGALRPAPQGLSQKVAEILAAPEVASGFAGVLVVSLRDDEVWVDINSDRRFMPASNLKLITSAAALDRLGPDFRWKTRVLAREWSASQGVAKALVLVGGGDATLSAEDLAALARKAADRGLREVRGPILADASLFDTPPLGRGWAWDYEADYYAAQVSALTVSRGTVPVRVRPGARVGAPAVVSLGARFPGLSVVSTAATGARGSSSTLEVTRDRATNRLRVTGAVPLGGEPETVDVAVEDPAAYAGWAFLKALRQVGVRVLGGVQKGRARQTDLEVAHHWSPPLSEVLRLLNKPSDNLIAETLLSTLGARRSPGSGTLQAGLREVSEFLREVGAKEWEFAIADGSGLSRLNEVTPRLLVRVLAWMDRHRQRGLFRSSLPLAGVDGTLRRRLTSGPAHRRVQAKTGTLTGASGLSGYARDADEEPLAFSILMNHFHGTRAEARALQDRIVEAICGSSKERAARRDRGEVSARGPTAAATGPRSR